MRYAALVSALAFSSLASSAPEQTPPEATAEQSASNQQDPNAGLPDEIAGKSLDEILEDWPDQYVRWIITESESEYYKTLTDNKERLQFIEYFWSRRDPTPQTAHNEYRTEYLERYAFAANRLSAGKPGWATDRGRIYLILGPPHGLQRNPTGRYGIERPSEVWTYNNLDIPDMPASIDFEFVDFNGTGDFELVQDIDTAAPMWTQFGTTNNALDAIAQRRLVIGEVDPVSGFDNFRNVDNTRLVMQEFDLQRQMQQVFLTPERDLAALDEVVQSRAAFGVLALEAAAGAVRAENAHSDENGGAARVPVSLTLPYRELNYRQAEDDVLFDLEYLILVTTEDGEAVAQKGDLLQVTFPETEIAGLNQQKLSIDENLEVPPGSYKLQAFIRDKVSERIGKVDLPLAVPDIAREGLSLSSVFLARALLKSGADAAKPFQFGTVRVIPSTDRTFSTSDSLGVYVQAYGATMGDDKRSRLKVDFFVMRDARLFMGVPASHLRPDTDPIGITGDIPLRKCTPGNYVLRVRVTDELAGTRAESEQSFVVVGGPSPG